MLRKSGRESIEAADGFRADQCTRAPSTETRTANEANEITSISGGATPEYDAAGNMVVGPKPGAPTDRQHYKYDAWNRLVQVSEDDNGDPGDEVAVFEYDGRNYRIRKTDDQQVVTAYYYNEDWQVLEERLDGDVERQYVWNPEYVDSLATTYTDNGTGFDQHYYLHDANYNITAVVDDSGAVVERYAYTPYGEVTYLDDAFDPISGSTIDNEHLYTGRRTDAETGLQLNRNRYYQADLGRWINRDPIGYGAGDLNVYAYVGGRVTSGLDPSGLANLWNPWTWGIDSPQQGWGGFFNPLAESNPLLATTGGFWYGAAIRGPYNIGSTLAGTGKEMACMCADLAGSEFELANRGVSYVFDATTGISIPVYRHGDWSATSSGLTSGDIGYGDYYFDTSANLLTAGVYGQGVATYQYSTGQITADQYSGQLGATGILQLAGARGLRSRPGTTAMGEASLGENLSHLLGNTAGKPHVTDVLIHANADKFIVWHNGMEVDPSHRSLALYLNKQGIRGNLRLLSCNAGKKGLAQNLANKLNVSVEAANVEVLVPHQGPAPPMLGPGGSWNTFRPGIYP